jgi:hypothetical protein
LMTLSIIDATPLFFSRKFYKTAGAPGKNRTCGTWIRNPMLYPLSYGGGRTSATHCAMIEIFKDVIRIANQLQYYKNPSQK